MFTPPVILDTNVFVASGFNKGSASRKIIDAIERRDLLLVWNEATRGETLAVLHKNPPLSRQAAEGLFRDEGRYDGPTHPERFEQVEDETDRKFAALGEAAGVGVVTSDGDLLGPRDGLRIAIYSPSEFVERGLP
ncbi:MAG: putative toxin-antitoxin system toxin component, PIN family [Persicimonas sp.]